MVYHEVWCQLHLKQSSSSSEPLLPTFRLPSNNRRYREWVRPGSPRSLPRIHSPFIGPDVQDGRPNRRGLPAGWQLQARIRTYVSGGGMGRRASSMGESPRRRFAEDRGQAQDQGGNVGAFRRVQTMKHGILDQTTFGF